MVGPALFLTDKRNDFERGESETERWVERIKRNYRERNLDSGPERYLTRDHSRRTMNPEPWRAMGARDRDRQTEDGTVVREEL